MRAAETLFLDKGYENVSLDEIATAAGVTRGAVHWHFRNKQGVLFAIRDDMRLPMQDLADQLAKDTTLVPLDALGNVISATFRRLQADPRQRPPSQSTLAVGQSRRCRYSKRWRQVSAALARVSGHGL